MKVERYFTKGLSSPYEGIEFVERVSKVFSTVDSMSEVPFIAPASWSQVAVDIIAQKYSSKKAAENDARSVFERLSSTWSHFAQKSGLLDLNSATIFKEECQYMLAHQIAAPNSPQWFNTGLFHQYKLTSSSQGHYYYDETQDKVIELDNALERPQAHACFIQGVRDELVGHGSIMDLWQREARLFKFGSGSGSNFSSLRGAGEPLGNGGVSSGLMSWLKIGDAAAGAVKSGGTTRRAAKMVCLDADHPDIEDFISWKYKEEQKVSFMVSGQKLIRELFFMMLENQSEQVLKTFQKKHCIDDVVFYRLVQMKKQAFTLSDFDWGCKLDFDWLGEAYQSVSAQNANNSIRLNHDFFKKLKSNSSWKLTNRTNSKVVKTIKASELFEKICRATWSCADPGVQFSDTINEWHTCPEGGKIVASNPCSEYMFLDDTACNLASINLVKFLEEGRFNADSFKEAVKIWTIVLETSVGMASYPSPEIAKKSYEYRTLGLGFANLGGLLLRMGLPYDSKEGRSMAASLTSLLSGEAYRVSSLMAQDLGSFSLFEKNKKHCLRVLNNHYLSLYPQKQLEGVLIESNGIDRSYDSSKTLLELAEKTWQESLVLFKKFGLRNAQVSAIAPTGTISLLMDCDTTGIEPDFSLVKFKTLVSGGVAKIVNQSVDVVLDKLGHSKEERRDIEEFILKENGVVGAPYLDPKNYSLFDCAQDAQESKRFLSLGAHLLMMASVQPFVSGAISKTINLPSESTIEDVKKAYLKAYGLGLKSLAIYRDQSKLSQPLNVSEDEKSSLYSHLACLNCGEQMLLPAGTCMRCDNCGESTSCS
jgi:ribonucleoside-diphosphate reductase alpha chain